MTRIELKQQPQNAELLASQCVTYIKGVIDIIRSIPEFDVVQYNRNIMIHQKQQQQQQQRDVNLLNVQLSTSQQLTHSDVEKTATETDVVQIITPPPLYSRIVHGTTTTSTNSLHLQQRINDLYQSAMEMGSDIHHQQQQQQQDQEINQNKEMTATATATIRGWSSCDSFWNISNQVQHHQQQKQRDESSSASSSSSSSQFLDVSAERSQLLYKIVLPLLATLGRCYEILDQLPTTPVISVPSQQLQLHTNHNTNNKSKSPLPPIAMLSLQNYTDIACLIEFLVCNYIVPFVPHHILIPIHDRVRYHLPKALAGRIPMLSLLWSSSSSSSSSLEISHQKQQQQQLPSSLPVVIQSTVWREWEHIVCILGRLLLLDRFRPMLLPRHITDVVAIILYRQEYCRHTKIDDDSSSSNTSYQQIVNSWIGMTTTGTSSTMIQRNDRVVIVDSYWRVKAYQGLLRNGRTTPFWLRTKVAHLLTQVATYDLAVLMAVFVHEAIDQDYSSAALRLAQALVTKDMMSSKNDNRDDMSVMSANDEYFNALCDQLIEVLDSWTWDGKTDSISVHNAASIGTIWAVLDLLPQRTIDGYLFHTLVVKDSTLRQSQHNNHDTYNSDIHKVIRRFTTLFSIGYHNMTCVAKICRSLFRPLSLSEIMGSSVKPNDTSELSLLGMIIRLAASPGIMKSLVKDDAILMLKLFVNTMIHIQYSGSCSPTDVVPGVDVLIIVILRSLAPCALDSEQITFDFNCEEPNAQGSHLQFVQQRLRKIHLIGDAIMDFSVKGVEDRVRLVIQVILMNSIKDEHGVESNDVMALLFHTLLAAYFCPEQISIELRTTFCYSTFLVVPMVALPLICEGFPPEVLLSLESDTGIFDIMAVIISSAMTQCLVLDQESNKRSDETHVQRPSVELLTRRLRQAENIAFPRTPQQNVLNSNLDSFWSPDDEMILSMTSVVLGLLVSILELGAKTRSMKQETMLQSFVPKLLILADSKAIIAAGTISELISVQVQIAEMASLAATLIVSRECSMDGKKEIIDDRESPIGFLVEAENDVLSDLPPIRARAMVLLRNRTVAISEQRKHCRSTTNDDDELVRILLVCTRALNDNESYVYLAAIHTIVAVADSDPNKFIPIIGIALVTGLFDDDKGQKLELTLEQRTKLTEALAFVVRRRNLFYPILPFLIDLLIVGLKQDNNTHSANEARLIHDATHRYFVTGIYDDMQSDNIEKAEIPLDDYWKEIDLRVRTGGPIFDTENVDVVRSGMMMVVGDLISVLSPSTTARYATILIVCCIDTLRLESSRPVRRAGATMARELYGALVREQDELLEAISNKNNFDAALSVAMVEGYEENLFGILQRIVSNADCSVKYNGIERLDDPALSARCHEAIALRHNADEGGIILAGKVALEAKRYNSSNHISQLLNSSNTSIVKLKIEEL